MNHQVILLLSGTLAAVFVGGIVVGFILTPFARALGSLDENTPHLRNAGTYIGWFERALFFAFIVGGQQRSGGRTGRQVSGALSKSE
jgi:hypothetical protein